MNQTKSIIDKKLTKSAVKPKILAIKLDVSNREEVRKVAQEAKYIYLYFQRNIYEHLTSKQ